ncbi:MAG: sensor domain-containing diguanylate cyclase [Candidatus Omnitrophota bacterium]
MDQDQDISRQKNTYGGDKHLLDLFLELSDALRADLDINKSAQIMVSILADMFNAGRVSFMQLDESSSELSVQASLGLDPAVIQAKVKLGDSFCGQVAKEGRLLLVNDIETEYPDLPRSRLARYQSKSFVILPVECGDKVHGVLSITDKKDQEQFSSEDLKILNLVSSYFALYLEKTKLSERNKLLSVTDPLTGLFSHRYFQEQLLEEMNRSERYRRPLSIVIVDIDKFTDYNQAHGYAAGDIVLKQVALLLKENFRKVDVVCRYGLDGFSIILPETKIKEAIFVAEKLREKMSMAVFTEDEARKSSYGMSRLTVSIGIAEHSLGLPKEDLIRHVTGALFECQQKGGNRVCVSR